ncbi:Long-chain-alcohol O-fatty-acyltransferase [Bienertia sinuspersici]
MKIWSLAVASAYYVYCLSHIQKGFLRLVFILPVIYLFVVLPSSLSSFHLGGPTIFYLVWLANFKLLLYSFNLGPLSTLPNNSSLSHFIFIALLPIKVNASHIHNKNRDPHPSSLIRSALLFGVKLIAFVVVIKLYEIRQDLPNFVLLLNYCCHLYLGVEITLGVTAALVRPILGMGLGLDPQFNEPYLATSLQDFWGRRWNLMVSDILRLSVYDPIRRVASPLVGRKWALVGGMLASFTVSGLMHEVIYFYFTRVKPTWEVTWFFVLHGVCTVVEVVVKEAVNGRLRLHRLISGPLTIGFLGVTAWWLFLPQLLRSGLDVKAIDEYPLMLAFVKENMLSFVKWIS